MHAREILAEGAWPGRSPAELDAWADEHAQHPTLPDAARLEGVADYARVIAVQLGRPEDRARARTLYEAMLDRPGWDELHREHVEMLMSLRVLGGDPEGAARLSVDPRVRNEVAEAVLADAHNPALNPAASADVWAEHFNAALHGPSLAPFLAPEGGDRPNLDRLRTAPCPTVDRPERVTVLMSAFRRDNSLLTSVRSVLHQTWSNLELFVIDDASGPGPDGEWSRTLDRAASLDPRVRVLRKAVNGGTYRARNSALRLATGDFAIVLDSDDWWHPQTLELCAAPLLAHPGLVATRAQGVRVTTDLVITRPGYRPRFPSAPTVLYRLPEVLSRLGFYDPTRKGADNEHARRIEAAYGRAIFDVRETTTLQRQDGETLSSDEFGSGWRHPARHQYKGSYTQWHRQIAAGEASPYLDPELPRVFPEPRRWARAEHPLLAEQHVLDLCLAGDWTRMGGPQRSMLAEIRAARAAGLRVGIMHLEALRFMTVQDLPLVPEVLELVHSGEVDWVLADDDIDIDVLMVRYPPILQYPPTLHRRVRARTVLIVANQAPIEPDGSDPRYVVSDVTERAEALFGRPVSWVPQSPVIRQVLVDQDPGVSLTDWDNPGLIDIDEWAVRPPMPPGLDGRPVVVGRHSRDDGIKFPSTWAELFDGYSFGRGFEVRMLGATGTVNELRDRAGRKELPRNWELLRSGSIPVRDFLAGLDFYLYLDNAEAHEAFGRVILEAAASGVLTIAHPKHRATFGDLVDYAAPGEAQELVARYVHDPEAYEARVRRTQELVRERYSGTTFTARLRTILDGPAKEDAPPAQVRQGGAAEVPAVLTVEEVRLRPGATLPTVRPLRTTDDEVDQRELEVVRIPFRTAADAERGGSLTIVHAYVPEDELGGWARGALARVNDPSWSITSSLGSAPGGVLALLLRRDGEATAWGRGDWSVGAAPSVSAPAASLAPLGWSSVRWRCSHPPQAAVLSLHHDQES